MQWIQEQGSQPFQVPVPNLPRGISTDQVQAYGWIPSTDTSVTRIAYLRNERLVRVSKRDVKQGPTFGQVVEGLGIPTTINRSALEYEQVLYTVGLDYPMLGITVYATGLADRNKMMHDGKLAIYMTSSLQVSRIECYKPAPLETALQDSFFLSTESISVEMQSRSVWPGFDTWINIVNSQ